MGTEWGKKYVRGINYSCVNCDEVGDTVIRPVLLFLWITFSVIISLNSYKSKLRNDFLTNVA